MTLENYFPALVTFKKSNIRRRAPRWQINQIGSLPILLLKISEFGESMLHIS